MFALKETTELIPEQIEFGDVFQTKHTMGLFDLPGAGKTLSILSAICTLLYPGQKSLIVCPPHLVPNWKYEINKFTHLIVGEDIDVYPYTQLGKKLESFAGYTLVAADEAHALKNDNAKRTIHFMDYLKEDRPDFFIYATGTPVENRLPEIYNFLTMLAEYDHVYPKITVKYPTYYEFCERFCYVKSTSYGSGVKYYGMRKENLAELREYLKPWTIRRKPGQLPDMDNQKVIVSYGEDTALARAFSEYRMDEDSTGGLGIVEKKEAAIAKAPFTAEWMHNELEGGHSPLVVFSDHREPVETIADYLQERGWRVGVIIGGQNMNYRDDIVRKFQDGKLDAIVSTSAGYTGITLTKSDTVIVNDPPWKPSDLDQLRRRVLRHGQTKPTRCVYMIGSRADEYITDMIKGKIRVINAVVEA